MPELLKNYYNLEFISRLSEHIYKEYPSFDPNSFNAQIFDNIWESRELKERMRHITKCLKEHLPGNYIQALEILMKVAPDFRGLTAIIFPDFVETYGLEYENESIAALEWFTPFSSSEFAIRPFIKNNPEKLMRQMLQWAKHENPHVRRLASEGCRPRLPWAMALTDFKTNPAPILPILEMLKADPSEYVRKSVANNLNDIAKDHPEVVLETIKKWKGDNSFTNWIIKHASRTLLKQGVAEALANFDFETPHNINVNNLQLSTYSLPIGEDFQFSFELINNNLKPIKLRLEYGIYYVKANGKTSRKVFQLTENSFDHKKSTLFKKKQSFKNLTTRKHYPGVHKLAIIVNGKEMNEIQFTLQDKT